MNTRKENLQFEVLPTQIPDTVSSVFNSILFLRSTGKFVFKDEGSYSIRPLNVVDETCNFVDLTYVRVDCNDFKASLMGEIERFNTLLRSSQSQSGEIVLTFYQKKEKRWPFMSQECVPWEMWTLQLNLIHLPNEHERRDYGTQLAMMIGEKLLYITDSVSRDQFVPKNPNQSDMDNVFDVTYPHVQPYLFRIDTTLQTPQNTAMDTFKKFVKDTLRV